MADKDDDYKDLSGEFMQTESEESDVRDTDDGGAIVTLEEAHEEAEREEHFANLAQSLDSGLMAKIADDLLDAIERDKRARENRDKQQEMGIQLSGLSDDDKKGADIEGGSIVSHPMITEACIDFAARAMKELFPPAGPAKDQILGEVTTEKIEKARRKTRLLNRQATKEIKEARAEMEQMLSQVPLGGSQYMKVYRCRRRKRTATEFVPIDDILLPYAATNFECAERKTHVQRLTELGYRRKIKSGEYIDVDSAPEAFLEKSASAEAAERVEGKEEDPFNADGLRTMFEVATFLDIEDEDDYLPYLVTIDNSSRRIVSIYRNWDEEDPDREELTHIVEFPFIPWRGAYALGMPQIVGGLTQAMTGALRALLDSAHINNIPTAIRLAGGASGQTVALRAGRIAEIEGAIGTDNDIRKNVMPIPFNQPSPVLFQLLGFLDGAAKHVVRTTFEDLAEQKQEMPVGTTVALIEQGMTVFSAIHGRLHDAMRKVLEIMHRLNRYHLTENVEYDEEDEPLATRSDFDGPMDVAPASDPKIFSETQRMAQVQAVAQRQQATAAWGVYDPRKTEKWILEAMQHPDPDAILMAVPEAQNLNAVNENAAAMLGKPVTAFPDQDHLAHITTHLDFLRSPVLGGHMFLGKAAIPTLVNHMREHVVLLYISMVEQSATELAGQDISKLMDPKSDEVMAEFDRLMANVSPQVTGSINQVLQSIIPEIDKYAQIAQQMQQQQMPADPKAQAAMAEVNRKQAKDQQDSQLAMAEQQRQAQKDAAELQVKQQGIQQAGEKNAADAQLKATGIQVDHQKNVEDNSTALTLAQMEIDDAKEARAEAAQQRDEDRAVEAQQREEDRMHGIVSKAADQQFNSREKALDREFKGEKVGVSTGTGINP